MQETMTRALQLAQGARKQITALEGEVERSGLSPNSSEFQLRISQTRTLMQNFQSSMAKFDELRGIVEATHRQAVSRKVYTLTGQTAAEEELDRLIESGESEQLVQNAIQSQGREKVLDTLAEINERHSAVKELERSMMEMHQMFLDMGVLVEQQGAFLNNISDAVATAREEVVAGVVHIGKARETQKSNRRLKLMVLSVLILIILIIILAVVLKLTVFK